MYSWILTAKYYENCYHFIIPYKINYAATKQYVRKLKQFEIHVLLEVRKIDMKFAGDVVSGLLHCVALQFVPEFQGFSPLKDS